MQRYRVLFFDLDHTLVDTRRQYHLGLEQTVRRLYGDRAPESFIERFMHHHESLWPLYDRREMTMADLRRERFLRAWRDFGVEPTLEEADVFQKMYEQTFDETLFAYPDTAEMLDTLAADHRLGIITNGAPDLQWRKLEVTGLARHFRPESVIISECVGLAKPHPSVFQAACDALHVTPADALMIGDNYVADVQGALAFGMDAIWYAPDREVILPDWLQTVQEPPISSPGLLVETVARLEQARGG